MKQTLLIVLLLLTSFSTSFGQAPKKTMLERLGYPPDTKLLIIHADDLGMAHSVNAASVKAFDTRRDQFRQHYGSLPLVCGDRGLCPKPS